MAQGRMVTPRPQRTFYGWVIVAAMFVVGGVVMVMGSANLGLFVIPMSADLGIGQAPFGWANTALLVAVAVSAPVIGRLLDRYGARGPLAVAAILAGLSVLALAFIAAS